MTVRSDSDSRYRKVESDALCCRDLLSLYLQEPQTGPLLDSMELRDRIKTLSPALSS